MATTVVPWLCSGRVPGGSWAQAGAPPVRASTSTNDGPGSSSARKVGRVIEAEATGCPAPRPPGPGNDNGRSPGGKRPAGRTATLAPTTFRSSWRLLAALLDVALHEVLSVALEDLV